MAELSKKYDAKTREKFWQNHWKDKKIFSWQDDKPKDQTFVIDTPPPTVSGLLHMGHVFSYCQADFVARFQRMSGKDVFYPMGFDDNGLPTERLVEKVIKKKAGVYEHENGRGSFVNKCREVVETAEEEFEALFNSIALSVDWEQKYQTISPQSQKISQASFVDLYKKNLVEKKFEPVFWDISDRTALAQADLIDKDVEGVMNEIEFGLAGLDEKLVIMTTRPELLPACVAVMIHPEDERYKHLHGKKAITPLFGIEVPIICDDLVQLDKGTGAVMCCTFGDETDISWWKKHSLDLKVIISKDGKIRDLEKVGIEGYLEEALPIKKFKAKVIEDLEAQNLLLKQETIKRPVKCAERSGVPIEILVVEQWFIKILDKKELLKKKAEECQWFPKYMKVRIDQWIDGLAWDWCISRQRFFGVSFPIWYSKRAGEEGKILVADIDQLPCDPAVDLPKGYNRDEVEPETDIMDTWATSSVSPQLSSHGISDDVDLGQQERHKKLFPADLRPQAHEIIRTWAFYTIVKSALHEDEIPWQNLMISGWCLAADKTKMSKSKGNVVTPTALIQEKGSDIVRYWASTSHLGTDTAYSEDVFKIGQKLVTKLFNAAKFASMKFDILTDDSLNPSDDRITQASDLWVLNRLKQVVINATEQFDKFEYAKAREYVEEFFWKDFCDNYLEICKVRSYGVEAQKFDGIELSEEQKDDIRAKQESAVLTLRICLNTLIKVFAPFIPHICDEIYSVLFESEFNEKSSINARGNWPKFNDEADDVEVGNRVLEVIAQVRKFKSDNNLSMKTVVQTLKVPEIDGMEAFIEDLGNVCNAKNVELAGDRVEVIL